MAMPSLRADDSGYLGFGESSEFSAFLSHAYLDGFCFGLLFDGRFEGFEADSDGFSEFHVVLVFFFEDFYGCDASDAHAGGFVGYEGSRRIRLEEVGPEFVASRHEEGGPERAVPSLGVLLLGVADLFDEHLDGHVLAEVDFVLFRNSPGIVHEDSGVCYEAGGRASGVFVDLVDFLGGFGFDEPVHGPPVHDERDPSFVLDSYGR